jgi:hypothetical protein
MRVFAFLLCAVFLAGSLSASVFLLTQAHHRHDAQNPPDGCVTCVRIQLAERLLRQLAGAVVCAAALLGILSAAAALLKSSLPAAALFTPITLKVRLNR